LSEFRRHKKTDNPLHIIGFLSQWKMYLDELPSPRSEDAAKQWSGKRLDPTVFEKVFLLLLLLINSISGVNFLDVKDVGRADRTTV